MKGWYATVSVQFIGNDINNKNKIPLNWRILDYHLTRFYLTQSFEETWKRWLLNYRKRGSRCS